MEEVREEFLVKGIKARIVPSEDISEIKNLWGKFWNEGFNGKLKQEGSEDMPIAIYTNFEGDKTMPFDLIIGHKTQDEVSEEFEVVKVPKQKYVIFEKTGNMPDVVMEVWKEVWESDLNRSYTCDIEEYPNMNTVRVSIGVKE